MFVTIISFFTSIFHKVV